MDDAEFDRAMIAAAFQLAGEQGWRAVNVAAAARAAGLSLARARERFPGRLADQAALAEQPSDGPARDRLFDLLMRRIDVFQAHRAGVLALLRTLPAEPATALLLALATRRSMRWMLEAAGFSAVRVRGELRVKGLVAVWLWTMRAWQADASEDLSATMAALDAALNRAERAAAFLGWRAKPVEPPSGGSESGSGSIEPEPDPAA